MSKPSMNGSSHQLAVFILTVLTVTRSINGICTNGICTNDAADGVAALQVHKSSSKLVAKANEEMPVQVAAGERQNSSAVKRIDVHTVEAAHSDVKEDHGFKHVDTETVHFHGKHIREVVKEESNVRKLRSGAQHVNFSLAKTDTACAAKLNRFYTLNGQDLTCCVGADPYFPPDLTSIAGEGGECGDIGGGKSVPCDTFNQWKTFQQVADQRGLSYGVIRYKKLKGRKAGSQKGKKSGITFDDVDQVTLRNCYFLAALAAIAYHHPGIIDDMFVDRSLWDQNIFKTKWLLFGRESIIAVDNTIPADNTSTYFTQPSSTGEFWVVILAKAWAKIYGSFQAIESGSAGIVLSAITGAPTKHISLADETEDGLWETLLAAASNQRPMTAGTCSSCSDPGTYGLKNKHAYAILDAFVDPNYGKVLKIYNPWAEDFYKGAVPNTAKVNGPKPGVFTMLYSEFRIAYYLIQINTWHSGYQLIPSIFSVGSLHAKVVNVPTSGELFVSTVWPDERMIEPCDPSWLYHPSGFIMAELTTSPGQLDGTIKLDAYCRTLEIDNAGGTYNILASETFLDPSFLDTLALAVYAPAGSTVADLPDALTLALEMAAPVQDGSVCDSLAIGGGSNLGVCTLDKTTLMRGMPSYWNHDRSQVLYYDNGEWVEKAAESVDSLHSLGFWRSKKDLTCGGLEVAAPSENGQVCGTVTVEGVGEFYLDETQWIHSWPSYWNADKSQILYYRFDHWRRIGADWFDELVAGSSTYYIDKGTFSKADLICGVPTTTDITSSSGTTTTSTTQQAYTQFGDDNKTCKIETEFANTDFSTAIQLTLDECFQRCLSDSRCVYFTHNSNNPTPTLKKKCRMFSVCTLKDTGALTSRTYKMRDRMPP